MAQKTKQLNNEAEATQAAPEVDASVADVQRQETTALTPGAAEAEVQQKNTTETSTLNYNPATGVLETEGEGSKESKRKELADQVKEVQPEPDKLPPAAAAGIDPGYAEDYRKAQEIQQREELAKLQAEQDEQKRQEASSSLNEDQYTKRLAELERRSNDPHLAYNDRYAARQESDMLRAVLNDMKGQGSPTGPTVAQEDRPS